MKKISVLAVFSIFLFVLSCSRDKAPEISCDNVASWDLNIREIIQTNCVYSGCHDGGSGIPGIYFEYSGLVPWLNDGGFETRVVSNRDMPPAYAPDDKNKELPQADLDLILCWIEEGYPEN